MVHELDTHDISGRDEAGRQLVIIPAGRRIARRMIVERHERRGPRHERLTEDLARIRQTAVERSYRNQAGREQAIPRVEQHHAEPLDSKRAELRQEIRRNVAGVQELRTLGRGPQKCAASELDRGVDTTRLGGANSDDARQLVAVQPRESVRAAGQP